MVAFALGAIAVVGRLGVEGHFEIEQFTRQDGGHGEGGRNLEPPLLEQELDAAHQISFWYTPIHTNMRGVHAAMDGDSFTGNRDWRNWSTKARPAPV